MEKQTKKRIDEYLKTHGGVIRTSDFQKAGFHNSYLSVLTEEGFLVRLKAGLYIAAETQTVSGFYEIQLALPNAVICLASALTFYEMSTYERRPFTSQYRETSVFYHRISLRSDDFRLVIYVTGSG